jgi:hypothetical protein
MTKIPALIGTTARYNALGTDNTGNVLHAIAARNLLQDHVEFPTSREWTPEDLEKIEGHSHIVIVMANAVRLGRDTNPLAPHHEIMRRNIERTTRPVVVFGLGAQAPYGGETSYRTPPETLNLLKVISERSRRIAVRGEFTADTLRIMGIDNPEVIGCQSCFLSREPEFPHDLVNLAPERTKAVFNYTSMMTEKKLIKTAVENGLDMVGQIEVYEAHAKEGVPYDLGKDVKKFQDMLAYFGISEEQYAAYCRLHFSRFADLDTWLKHMRQYRFSFGTRFHGNMFALQAGTPSLWVVHDERTRELCKFLNLPQISLEKALELNDVGKLREKVDYSEFLKTYPERYRRLKAYVQDAGLAHRLN